MASPNPPLILISPSAESKGAEFGDTSISLADTYQLAIMRAGGVPLILPSLTSPEIVAECVRRCDGVLLTGGDDVNPRLYTRRLPPRLAKTVTVAAGGQDLRELLLIKEVFQRRKPVFGICRGHQLLNVALGGALIVDIPSQMPAAINHNRQDKKNEIVHEARLTGGTLLARIVGKQFLGVNSTHHQAIGRVAGPLLAAARSADGIVEATELKPEAAHLLPYYMTVQFHPERLAARHPAHQALFNWFVRACSLNHKRNL